jgi:predicted amidohydrolase YtcJ
VQADLVITNGKVITVDKDFSIKQAAAVMDSKILAVGTNDEVKPFITSGTRVLDLKGKTILPGINDSHCHPGSFGAYRPPMALDVGQSAAGSIREIAALIADRAENLPTGAWIIGRGWDLGNLADNRADPDRWPIRDDLDPVSPHHPVALVDFSGHNLWANSLALAEAGITEHGPEVEGGQIKRHPQTGRPTGMLVEWGARGLVDKVIPLFSRAEKKQAFQAAIAEFNSQGVTSLTDAALGPAGENIARGMWSSECLNIYDEMSRAGELNIRVNILLLLGQNGCVRLQDMIDGLAAWRPPQGLDPNWVRLCGVKVFADGLPITKTAWMHEDYLGGGRSELVIPGKTEAERVSELHAIIGHAHDRRFQIGVHATGDAAIDATVAGFVQCQTERPGADLRHYIIHGDFISAATARTLASHNLGLSMQPTIKALIADQEEGIVGQRRAAYEWPMRTVLDAGVHLAASSDAPVTYPNWREGVQSAVLREAKGSGMVSGPDQCISVPEAIRMYTINGAWQDHMEKKKGSLEVGKLADFCILGEDILTVDPHEIREIPVLMTIVGGKIVYDESGGILG